MRFIFVLATCLGIMACTAGVDINKTPISSRVSDACDDLASLCTSTGQCTPQQAFCGPLRTQFITAFQTEDTCKNGCADSTSCIKTCKSDRTTAVTSFLTAAGGDSAGACTLLQQSCTTSSQGCVGGEFFCSMAPAPSPCADALATCKAACVPHDRPCLKACKAAYSTCLSGGTMDGGVPPTMYNLTYGTTAGSTGTGTVTVNPAGASCGTNCSSYAANTMVTLTATPSAGSTFTGWTGCTSTTNTCTVTVTGVTAVTAAFTLSNTTTNYNLTYGTTAGSTGTGTVAVNPAGTSCGAGCSTYAAGTMVTLTATPATGSAFTSWTGCTSTTNTCTVTVNAAMAVTAKFTLNAVTTYNLTYGTTAGSTGTGTISRNPAGTSCGTNCAAYASGTMVTLTAVPATGSTFTSWTGCTSTTTTCTVTMSAAMTVTAKFTLSGYTYTKDMAPNLVYCSGCHSGSFPPQGYKTDTYANLFGGGSDTTPNVIAGDPTSKLLVYIQNNHQGATTKFPGWDVIAYGWIVNNAAAQ